jgi:amino acid permease
MICDMAPVFAVVWHFWIAVLIAVPAILLVIGLVVSYVRKVEMPRYPRD